jgi:signal transduction histidine kinase
MPSAGKYGSALVTLSRDIYSMYAPRIRENLSGDLVLNDSTATGSLYNAPAQLKLPVFALLIAIGITLEVVVHYVYNISTVYTHFYYVIVVVAGLWYGRKAIWVALFFGGLHIAVSWLLAGAFPSDAVLRALMLLIVAIVIGTVVEQMNRYHDQVRVQNCELKEINVQLDASQKATLAANKKLNLLSSITRHDIKNQLTALLAYIELSKMIVQDNDLKRTVNQEKIVADNILRQIEFTKDYEEIGVNSPQWQNVAELVSQSAPVLERSGVQLDISTGDLEVFADPLLLKVFENLVDNSLRHGEHVRHISVGYEKTKEDIVLMYRDDGAGVPATDKERIFQKGFGKNTGLGLFLTREILSITGLSIQESGVYGEGVLFLIKAPEGCWREGKKSVPNVT